MKTLVERLASKYKLAGARVGGLSVLDDVPNTGSIRASLTTYRVLPGIRSVPMWPGKPSYYSASEERRTLALAEQISTTRQIKPLIIVETNDDAYVLEGGHRLDALRELGVNRFPALVVVDLE